MFQGFVQCNGQFAHHLVNLRLSNDQRRADAQAGTGHRSNEQTAVLGHFLCVTAHRATDESGTLFFVGHQLNGTEQASATHFTHQRVISKLSQTLLQIGTGHSGVFKNLIALINL